VNQSVRLSSKMLNFATNKNRPAVPLSEFVVRTTRWFDMGLSNMYTVVITPNAIEHFFFSVTLWVTVELEETRAYRKNRIAKTRTLRGIVMNCGALINMNNLYKITISQVLHNEM